MSYYMINIIKKVYPYIIFLIILLIVFLIRNSHNDKKCQNCLLFNNKWESNMIINYENYDKKDSLVTSFYKDTIHEELYMSDTSYKNLMVLDYIKKTYFEASENKIITSKNTLNYLFFKYKNIPYLIIYNSKTKEPSYVLLQTEAKIKLKKIKSYKDIKEIISHIPIEEHLIKLKMNLSTN